MTTTGRPSTLLRKSDGERLAGAAPLIVMGCLGRDGLALGAVRKRTPLLLMIFSALFFRLCLVGCGVASARPKPSDEMDGDGLILAPKRGRSSRGSRLRGLRRSSKKTQPSSEAAGGQSAKDEKKDLSSGRKPANTETKGRAELDERKGDAIIVMTPPKGEHFLENTWSVWFDKRGGGSARPKGGRSAYISNLRRIGSFCTVEGMWRHLNHMIKPSQIEVGGNYRLFKHSIKPMWEDKANSNGGKWIIQIPNNLGSDSSPGGQGSGASQLDACWLNMVLGLCGETIDEGDEVCGVVVSRRKQGDRIAVWNRNKGSQEAVKKLGDRIREAIVVGIDPAPTLEMEYREHGAPKVGGLTAGRVFSGVVKQRFAL